MASDSTPPASGRSPLRAAQVSPLSSLTKMPRLANQTRSGRRGSTRRVLTGGRVGRPAVVARQVRPSSSERQTPSQLVPTITTEPLSARARIPGALVLPRPVPANVQLSPPSLLRNTEVGVAA